MNFDSFFTMLDSFLRTFISDVSSLSERWDSFNSTYRAAGCLLVSLLLIWDATRIGGQRDRKFFVTGAVALGLLAYGAMLFSQSTNGR
jgi:hypothetical protein